MASVASYAGDDHDQDHEHFPETGSLAASDSLQPLPTLPPSLHKALGRSLRDRETVLHYETRLLYWTAAGRLILVGLWAFAAWLWLGNIAYLGVLSASLRTALVIGSAVAAMRALNGARAATVLTSQRVISVAGRAQTWVWRAGGIATHHRQRCLRNVLVVQSTAIPPASRKEAPPALALHFRGSRDLRDLHDCLLWAEGDPPPVGPKPMEPSLWRDLRAVLPPRAELLWHCRPPPWRVASFRAPLLLVAAAQLPWLLWLHDYRVHRFGHGFVCVSVTGLLVGLLLAAARWLHGDVVYVVTDRHAGVWYVRRQLLLVFPLATLQAVEVRPADRDWARGDVRCVFGSDARAAQRLAAEGALGARLLGAGAHLRRVVRGDLQVEVRDGTGFKRHLDSGSWMPMHGAEEMDVVHT